MNKPQIHLSSTHKNTIAKELSISRQSVFYALNYRVHSKQAREIRMQSLLLTAWNRSTNSMAK
jgi:hypothetical protein